jgi:hypothetical protein
VEKAVKEIIPLIAETANASDTTLTEIAKYLPPAANASMVYAGEAGK